MMSIRKKNSKTKKERKILDSEGATIGCERDQRREGTEGGQTDKGTLAVASNANPTQSLLHGHGLVATAGCYHVMLA